MHAKAPPLPTGSKHLLADSSTTRRNIASVKYERRDIATVNYLLGDDNDWIKKATKALSQQTLSQQTSNISTPRRKDESPVDDP
jgi:hypothetical protein